MAKVAKPVWDGILVRGVKGPLELAVLVMYLVPKNFLSWLTGVAARLRLPSPCSLWLCRTFVRVFGINMEEASLPLSQYATIEDVFTRTLKPGARVVESDFCSPADGFLAQSNRATSEEAVQVKGHTYSLKDLFLGDIAVEVPDLGIGRYYTVYLAPHNYHRVHAPMAGELVGIRYLPGELWPVNLPFVRNLPRLFTRNERLVFEIRTTNHGYYYLAMVGAFNVGRMQTPWAEHLVTNALSRQFGATRVYHKFPTPAPIQAGQELGTFMLGSTVVVGITKQALDQWPEHEFIQINDGNLPVRMGQSLLK